MRKWLIRLIVLPGVMVLTVMEWCGIYITQFAGMLCRLAAGTIFIVTIVAYLMGLASKEQAATTLVSGFLLFLIPRVAGILVSGVTLANTAMMGLLKVRK